MFVLEESKTIVGRCFKDFWGRTYKASARHPFRPMQ
jgi:hypothetical protein